MIIAAPFAVIYLILEAFLRSFKEIKMIVKIGVITNVVSTVLLIPLIYYMNLLGVSIYLLIFGIAPFLLFIIYARDIIKNYFTKNEYILKRTDKLLIFKIGSISLLSSLIHQGVIILIRKILITQYGYEQNGIYQSVLSVSISYFSIIYIFLTNYTLPKLSECRDDGNIDSELNNNLRFLILMIVPMMLLFLGYKEIGVSLLFSKNFISASSLFFPQFIGDLFRVSAALFGLWLIPKRKVKQIIIIDFIFNSILLGSVYCFIVFLNKSLIYVSYAYALSFSLHFVMYFIYTKYSIKFKIDRNIMLSFGYSIISLGIVSYLSAYYIIISYFVTPAVLLIWFLLVVKKYEIIKMKNLFLSYANKDNKDIPLKNDN